MTSDTSERSFEEAIECGLLRWGPDACPRDTTVRNDRPDGTAAQSGRPRETAARNGRPSDTGVRARAPGDAAVRNGLGDRAGTNIDPGTQVVQGMTVRMFGSQRSPAPLFLKWKGLEATACGGFFVRSGSGPLRPSAGKRAARPTHAGPEAPSPHFRYTRFRMFYRFERLMSVRSAPPNQGVTVRVGVWRFLACATLALMSMSVFVGSALAGPNAGGVLVVHDIGVTASGCPTGVPAPTCETVDTRIDDYATLACWRVYAAFPEGSSPRLKGLAWGVTMDDSVHVTWGQLPDPVMDFEITDGGWPHTSGCSIGQSFGTTQTDAVICCYWFAGYASSPGMWNTGPHPVQTSVFVDDGTPQATDPIADYGRLGFGLDGYTPCGVVNGIACCLPNGSCQILLPAACAAGGGTSHGAVPCTPDLCPALGACCHADGTCSISFPAACAAAGGAWQGASTTCTPNPCPQPQGICCYDDGTCAELGQLPCLQSGGDWTGSIASCEPNPCPQPQGACCIPSGICIVMAEGPCEAAGGFWWYWEPDCQPNPCPPPWGACCYPDGFCLLTDEEQCQNEGGQWLGFGTDCQPNPCPQAYGACCFSDGGCTVHAQYICGRLHGDFQGPGTACSPNPCPQPGGVNAGGVLVVHDVGVAYTLDSSEYPTLPPASCEAADVVLPPDSLVVWKVYAAFPWATHPRLKGLSFGAEFDVGSVFVLAAGLPAAGDAEILVDGWPGSSGGGTTITLAEVQTSRIVEICWIGGYGGEGGVWTTVLHPTQPTVFLDDSEPPQEDPIVGLGGIGFGVPGISPCSHPPVPGACCFEDGSCHVLTVEGCAREHGIYQEGSCSPNPCPQPPPDGACCFDLECRVLTPLQCSLWGGLFLGLGVPCEENICPLPIATEKMSWGRLKARFR